MDSRLPISKRRYRHLMRVLDRTFAPLRQFRVWFKTRTFPRCVYKNIKIVHMTFSGDQELFFERACDALDLIEEADPCAWRMVRRQIRYLVNEYLTSGGEYDRVGRACKVDFGRSYRDRDSEDADYEWYVTSLAATIVHEATHLRISSNHISYTDSTKERIERICTARMGRFLSRLHSDNYDLMTLAPAFDAAEWKPYWDPDLHIVLNKQLRERCWSELRSYWRRR